MAGYRIEAWDGSRVEELLQVWQEALPQDTLSLGRFRRKVLADANFRREGLQVARDKEGHPLGFAWAVCRRTPMAGTDLEPDTGYLVAFGVVPRARRQGIGGALLGAAEGYLRAQGRRVCLVSPYAPGYLWPGVDPDRYPDAIRLLEALGYREFDRCVAMHRSLADYALPPEVAAREEELRRRGYRVERLSDALIVSLLLFLEREFHPDWARAVRETLVHHGPDRILVAQRDGQVVGFCMYGTYDGVPDRFGPFGVAASERGIGLGKVLLHRCLSDMAGHGLHDAWFQWTELDSPAGHLYLRSGFTVTRSFVLFRKTLAEEG